MTKWKEQFDERYVVPFDDGTNDKFINVNPEILKDFISNLLKEQRAEIIGVIEGMKREVPRLDFEWDGQVDYALGYNQALEDIINKLNKE